MTDNIVLNPATGIRESTSFATDEIGGNHHQYVKIEYGQPDSAIPVSSTNPLPVTSDVVTTLTDGRQTVITPGIAVPVTSSGTCKWVTVTALPANTDFIWIGGGAVSGVSHNEKGTPLSPGDTITIPIDDASKIFIDAIVGGEGISFTVGS